MASKIEWEKLPPISQSYKNRYGTVPKTRTIKIGTKRRNIRIEIDRKPKPGEFEKNWKKQFEKEYTLELNNPVPPVKPIPLHHMFPSNRNVAPSEGKASTGPVMFSHEILEAAQAVLEVHEIIDLHCGLDLPDETTEPEPKLQPPYGPVDGPTTKKKNKKKKGQNGSA